MLTFESARKMFEVREGRSKSVRLEFNLRLVRLAPDLFGIQFHNSYLIRLWRDDTYTLNTAGHRTESARAVINAYSPAGLRLPNLSSRRRTEWKYSDGSDYADFDQIDSSGKLVRRRL